MQGMKAASRGHAPVWRMPRFCVSLILIDERDRHVKATSGVSGNAPSGRPGFLPEGQDACQLADLFVKYRMIRDFGLLGEKLDLLGM
jgi:hypothetical protein